VRSSHRLRQVINVINLSTALGLLIAVLGRARFQRGPDGLLLAKGYRLPVPPAPAFTVGNVVMLRLSDERLARRPMLLAHEARHSTQYAWCLGPVMLLLYATARGGHGCAPATRPRATSSSDAPDSSTAATWNDRLGRCCDAVAVAAARSRLPAPADGAG